MSKIVLYMSMSLDGFIAAEHDDLPGRGLGVGGEPLHAWLTAGNVSPESHRPERGVNAEVFDEMTATGAVIVGRRTFELAGSWGGDHHDGVPILVFTHHDPGYQALGHARHVTDMESAVRAAKAAAGDHDVMMHGAALAQSFLQAGFLDEVVLTVVPILLGRGRRLFEDVSGQLRLISSRAGEGVLHLRYQVVLPA